MRQNLQPKTREEDLLSAWNLPWLEMEVLIGGRSSVDLPRLRVRDWNEANNFVRCYGYQPNEPEDAEFMRRVLSESLSFMQRVLLPPEIRFEDIPEKIRACEDVRKLLLWASSVDTGDCPKLQAWSCAVLRIVHTIAHLEGSTKKIDPAAAAEQIQKRFLPFIRRDEQDRLLFGDRRRFIEIERIDWKVGKTRDSTILKLLHKPANVAETIYDQIGVRIVTKRIADVLMAIKFLRKFHMITFANSIPGRTRNTLINVDDMKQQIRQLRRRMRAGKISAAEFESSLEQCASSSQMINTEVTNNPHSGDNYHAIQLTCRQLIRVANPEIATVFFPFEIQVLDSAAYRSNQSGDASHDRYKESQIRASRVRVLGQVLGLVGRR